MDAQAWVCMGASLPPGGTTTDPATDTTVTKRECFERALLSANTLDTAEFVTAVLGTARALPNDATTARVIGIGEADEIRDLHRHGLIALALESVLLSPQSVPETTQHQLWVYLARLTNVSDAAQIHGEMFTPLPCIHRARCLDVDETGAWWTLSQAYPPVTINKEEGGGLSHIRNPVAEENDARVLSMLNAVNDHIPQPQAWRVLSHFFTPRDAADVMGSSITALTAAINACVADMQDPAAWHNIANCAAETSTPTVHVVGKSFTIAELRTRAATCWTQLRAAPYFLDTVLKHELKPENVGVELDASFAIPKRSIPVSLASIIALAEKFPCSLSWGEVVLEMIRRQIGAVFLEATPGKVWSALALCHRAIDRLTGQPTRVALYCAGLLALRCDFQKIDFAGERVTAYDCFLRAAVMDKLEEENREARQYPQVWVELSKLMPPRAQVDVGGQCLTATQCAAMGTNRDVTFGPAWGALARVINAETLSTTSGPAVNRLFCISKALELRVRDHSMWEFATTCLQPKETITVFGKRYNRVECAARSLELFPEDPRAWTKLAVLMRPTTRPVAHFAKSFTYDHVQKQCELFGVRPDQFDAAREDVMSDDDDLPNYDPSNPYGLGVSSSSSVPATTIGGSPGTKISGGSTGGSFTTQPSTSPRTDRQRTTISFTGKFDGGGSSGGGGGDKTTRSGGSLHRQSGGSISSGAGGVRIELPDDSVDDAALGIKRPTSSTHHTPSRPESGANRQGSSTGSQFGDQGSTDYPPTPSWTTAEPSHAGGEMWHTASDLTAQPFRFTAERFVENVRVGQGAFGKVYKAYDVVQGTTVAYKELSRCGVLGVAEAAAEYLKLSQLSHPNIVQVHAIDFGDAKEGRLPRIIMEYVPRVLCDVVASRRLFESAIRRYLRDILRGLQYLHGNGVVHRDLKPGNILVTDQGIVKISDFGTAREATGATTTTCAGTIAYMPPEAFTAKQKVQTAIDMWAVGCIALEMATGRRPWEHVLTPNLNPQQQRMQIARRMTKADRLTGDSHPFPKPLGEHLSGNLRSIIAMCLSVDPRDRPEADTLLVDGYFDFRDPLPIDAETMDHYNAAMKESGQVPHEAPAEAQPAPQAQVAPGFTDQTVVQETQVLQGGSLWQSGYGSGAYGSAQYYGSGAYESGAY